MKRHPHGRNIQQLEQHADPPDDASAGEIMAHRLAIEAGKALYGLRKQTIQPAFGIIKEAMGFRRFLMRGLEKVNLKWTLVTTSYNLKHLFNLGMRIKRGTKGLKGLSGGPADHLSIGNSVQQLVPKNFGEAPAGNSEPPAPNEKLISQRSSPIDC
jgi:hypothetical protein